MQLNMQSRGRKIYASFISSANQAKSIRSLVGNDIKIILKIETALGVTNVLEILDVSDKILGQGRPK